jgi:phage-related protein
MLHFPCFLSRRSSGRPLTAWHTVGYGRASIPEGRAQCIYVLHAFHKKAKKGIATPKEEIDLASKRYKELVRSLRRS